MSLHNHITSHLHSNKSYLNELFLIKKGCKNHTNNNINYYNNDYNTNIYGDNDDKYNGDNDYDREKKKKKKKIT